MSLSKKYLIEKEALEDESFDGQTQEVFPNHRYSDLQKKIWFMFEHPASSQGAKIVAMFSIFCIFVSTLLLTLDTLPFFQVFLHSFVVGFVVIFVGNSVEPSAIRSVCYY